MGIYKFSNEAKADLEREMVEIMNIGRQDVEEWLES